MVVFVGPCPVRFLLCFSAGWRSAYLAGGSAFRPLRFVFVVSFVLWFANLCENLETQVTYATQRENPGVGSKGEKPNNTTKKNLPLKHTVRLSQVPTFAPANRRKQQSLSLFPVLCFDSCLNQAWLVLSSPWDEKCATAHASLVACLLTLHKKKLSSTASAKQNWHLGKHIENLFVQVVCFRFVSKKNSLV